MDYNTQRVKLLLPEYGRNVQNMVNHMLSLTDYEERTQCAYSIVDVMGSMFPHLRDVDDFRHKLWDHLAIMSNFKLEINAPYALPDKSILDEKPDRVPYSQSRIRYKHYGKVIVAMIEKAISIQDEFERKQLVFLIANHMKKSFLVWNKDVVNDGKILKDLSEMSNGLLSYVEKDFHLAETKTVVQRVKKKRNPNKNIRR